MMACPYDARYVDEERGVVDKCTYCVQRIYQGRKPACLDTCPGKVRIFGDLNDPNSEISIEIAKHRTKVFKPEAGTMPRIYYVID
jgi:Fe-S-cluster-containing dehydrogenase component